MSLVITVRHQSASLVIPIGDPRDRFFYPALILMMDSKTLPYDALMWFVIYGCSISWSFTHRIE